MSTNYLLERLELEFAQSEFDYIQFAVRLGERSYSARFSSVYDPISDFKFWLEEIAMGGEDCRFCWDGEGPDFEFRYERVGKHLGKFRAGRYDEDGTIEGVVDRRQLLTTLYRGFMSYSDSYKFIWMNYEDCEYWQILTRSIGMDYPALLESLAEFDRDKLVRIFADARPKLRLSISFTNEWARWNDWGFHLNSQIGWKARVTDWHKAGFPIEWSVPLNFEKWNRQARIDFVEHCVSRVVGDYRSGVSLNRALHSPIVEDFLKKTGDEPEVDEGDLNVVTWDDDLIICDGDFGE